MHPIHEKNWEMINTVHGGFHLGNHLQRFRNSKSKWPEAV